MSVYSIHVPDRQPSPPSIPELQHIPSWLDASPVGTEDGMGGGGGIPMAIAGLSVEVLKFYFREPLKDAGRGSSSCSPRPE